MFATADEYRAGLKLLAQQQRGRLTSLIEQTERTLHTDWQHARDIVMRYYAPIIDRYAKDLAALRASAAAAGVDDASSMALDLSWLTDQNPQLASIQQSVSAAFNSYGNSAAAAVNDAQAQAVDAGAEDAAALTQRALWPAVEGAGVPPGVLFDRPLPEALSQWINRASNGLQIAQLFDGFGEQAAREVRQAMMLGLAMGENPRAMSSAISNALGISRSRATIIGRTEALSAYRSAQHEIYRANSDVLGGWLWSAGGPNPCFPAGTLITTRRGKVSIEQVKSGDEVLTHRGRYQRVKHVMVRPYTGLLVDVGAADGRAVTATSEHPFLSERQGQLNWVEASKLRLRHGVVCERERGAQIVHHDGSNRAIEGRIRQAHDAVASALQEERLARVSSGRAGMPVDAINLEHRVETRQIEVHRVAPASDRMLLMILNVERLETEARTALAFRLARVAAVTAHRAEAAIDRLTRLFTHDLAAFDAGEGMHRASAFFRAVMPIRRPAEDLATARTGTRRVVVGDGRAPHAASGAVDLLRATRFGGETFAARWTHFVDTTGVVEARRRAIGALTAAVLHTERLTALLTGVLDHGMSDLAALRMRMRLLMERITGARAEASVAPFVVGGRDAEGDAALLADNFHIQSITRLAHHIQHSGLLVFNLEVEHDQSYVANGFVVHNCAACMGMDGLQFSLEEELIDHPCGACSPLPVTRSWDDILGPLGIDTSDMEETSLGADGAYLGGEDRLLQMSPEQQRAVFGTKTGYEAWARGEVSLRDFAGIRSGGGYDGMLYQKSLRELQIPTRQASRLVEPNPELLAKLRAGRLRGTDLGRVTPEDRMPAWAKQSEASRIVYQILRNGLPYDLMSHEQGLLITNLQEMLRGELPVNVRAAVERQLIALGQPVERQTVAQALDTAALMQLTSAEELARAADVALARYALTSLPQDLADARTALRVALKAARRALSHAERDYQLAEDAVRADYSLNPHGLLSTAIEQDNRTFSANERRQQVRDLIDRLRRQLKTLPRK